MVPLAKRKVNRIGWPRADGRALEFRQRLHSDNPRLLPDSHPSNKSSEHDGNSQSVRYWYRFAEFSNRLIGINPVERYVIDNYAGDIYSSIQDALGALMDSWNP